MRYLGLTEADRRDMLAVIGAPGIDALFRDVPAGALNAAIDLPPHQGELEVERQFIRLAKKNLSPSEVPRSEEHTSELQSLMRISYAVFCLKKKNKKNKTTKTSQKYDQHKT